MEAKKLMANRNLTLVRFRTRNGEDEYYHSYYYPTEWVKNNNEETILKEFFNEYLYQDNTLNDNEWWNGFTAVSILDTMELPKNIDRTLLANMWIYGETKNPLEKEYNEQTTTQSK